MRIGSVERPATSVLQPNRVGADPQAFGAGVATALTGLGNTLQDAGVSQAQLEAQMREREERKKNQQRTVDFIRLRGETTRDLQQMQQEAPAGADGFTEQAKALVQERFAPFLAGIEDPESRAKFEAQIARFDENATTAAFTFEFNETNRVFGEQVNDLLEESRLRIREEPELLEQELDEFTDLIGDSTLPADEQQELLESVIATLQADTFQSEMQQAMRGTAPVGPGDGTDVEAPGLSAFNRATLNAIAGPESSGRYDAIHGGEKITDFSDHPRKFVTIESGPNKGKKSSAAGRYQFIASTWDEALASYNAAHPDRQVNDFSPVSQDLVAAHWLEVSYNRRNQNGPSFIEIRNDPSVTNLAHLRETLKGEWEGLGNLSDEEFAAAITGERGLAGGGTGAAEGPDIWNDERFNDIPFAQRVMLANAADDAERAAADEATKQAKKRRDDALDEANRMAFAGELNKDQVNNVAEQLNATAGERKALLARVDDARTRESTAGQVAAKLNNRETLTRDRDGQGLDALLQREGLTQGINERDLEAFNTARPNILRAGFIPEELRSVFQSQLGATDPQTRGFALSGLAALHRDNDRLLENSGFTEAEESDVTFFNAFRASFPEGEPGEQQLLEFMKTTKDRFLGQSLKQVQEAGGEAFEEEFETESDLLNLFSTLNPFDDEPLLPQVGAQRLIFISDARRAFIRGFAETGDADQAKKRMEVFLKRTWGKSSFGGITQLVKHPPERIWGPSFPDGLGPAENQLRLQLLANPDSNFVEGDTFTLVADSQTEADIAARQAGTRKELPSYQVIIQDANGIIKDAGQRFFPENTPDLEAQAQVRGNLARAESQRAEKAKQLIELKRGITGLPSEEREARQAQIDEVQTQLEQLGGMAEELQNQVDKKTDPAMLGKTLFEQIDREFLPVLEEEGNKQVRAYLVKVIRGSSPLPPGLTKREAIQLNAELQKVR